MTESVETPNDGFVKGPFETATLNGVKVHYRFRPALRKKDKRTIFLWHGFLGSVFSWNRVWDLFADNFEGNILAFDRPGFGYTERVLSASADTSAKTGPEHAESPERSDPYTYDTAASLGAALLKYLGISKAVYVGHSAGGTCTLFSYLKYPEVFDAIILVDAAIYTSGPPAFVGWLLGLSFMDSIGKWMTRKMLSASSNSMANQAFYDKTIAKDPKIMEDASKPLKENPTAMDALWLFSKRNLPENEKTKSQILAGFKGYGNVPVLIISGVNDKIVPLAEAKKLSENIPGATLVEISECGHVPIDEKPKETADAILNFLAQKVFIKEDKKSSSSSGKTRDKKKTERSELAESSSSKSHSEAQTNEDGENKNESKRKVKSKSKSKKKVNDSDS